MMTVTTDETIVTQEVVFDYKGERRIYTGQPIVVYTKPACVQCNATYKALDKHGIPYDVIDISADDESRDFVMALGYLQAPVVDTKIDHPDLKQHWSGFHPDKIKDFAYAHSRAA